MNGKDDSLGITFFSVNYFLLHCLKSFQCGSLQESPNFKLTFDTCQNSRQNSNVDLNLQTCVEKRCVKNILRSENRTVMTCLVQLHLIIH